MNFENISILVCDDSMLIRKKLIHLLREIGVQSIYEAENGLEAVEKVNSHQPQIVFMDIVMPVMDGIEAVETIKSTVPSTYIVMVSSVGTQTYLKKALKAGAADFIQKPYQSENIKQILSHFQNESEVRHV